MSPPRIGNLVDLEHASEKHKPFAKFRRSWTNEVPPPRVGVQIKIPPGFALDGGLNRRNIVQSYIGRTTKRAVATIGLVPLGTTAFRCFGRIMNAFIYGPRYGAM